ncbi:MAG: histidine phosphatase family protein [Jannaschia helgolandensis]|jgi:phosphohistidine phosphatase|uniref:Phosphohistidine phosphatase n=1 Tax=Jannaschia helgolandensis TaxID=188906 RepID=A0A1H7MGS1_9RHOB|nr:histidine phosphatase family protein [Jannaschia helgolandensis]SEL10540.1 phosphohistidine phosphatase [Jannaschia helgolandensis]|tara:strand:- start:94 stop:561 length:468 start_codon:yes stop_codon:yes gene_type:complete
MKLILLRHTKSDWSDPDQDDHDRPLNDRGRAAARAMGEWLTSRRHLPDLILCSDATRTRQTLAALGLPETTTETRPDLYLSDAEMIVALARKQTADCVLIVSHNPGIAEAAKQLAATPPVHPEFARYPTGACLVVEIVDDQPGRVLDFAVPRDFE